MASSSAYIKAVCDCDTHPSNEDFDAAANAINFFRRFLNDAPRLLKTVSSKLLSFLTNAVYEGLGGKPHFGLVAVLLGSDGQLCACFSLEPSPRQCQL